MNNLDFHKPVLINEVLQYMNCQDDQTYIDATFGAGGYSRALLEAANCRVIAFDRDASTQKFADNLQKKYGKRFIFFNKNFSQIAETVQQNNISDIDGIVYDFGVSSMQLDDKSRGFSFDSEEKLDMRMDKKIAISAFEVVNEFSWEDLHRIIKDFGEERKSKLIAKKIVEIREQNQITTCKELADIVRGFYKGYFKTDPATKTFQAIRIYVNNELEEIKFSLQQAIDILRKNGRCVTVSFHSLEDSIVKSFFKKEAGLDVSFSRYEPILQEEYSPQKTLEILTKSAIKPSKNEIYINPRSRSSRLRSAIKL